MSNLTGKKFGGRTKGTPNKVTAEGRKMLDLFLEEHFDEFEERMAAIEDPYEYCRLFVQMLNFVYPKIASVEVKEDRHRETFAEELDRLSGEYSR